MTSPIQLYNYGSTWTKHTKHKRVIISRLVSHILQGKLQEA